jgi:ABC-type transporter Mla MlaB component
MTNPTPNLTSNTAATTTQSLQSSPTNSVDRLTTEWIKVSLPAITTLSHLTDLKTQLLQYVGRRVELSGAKVERIDTATLQLLLAFINSPEITVGWIDPSPELCTAAHLLGLSSQLGLSTIGPD